MQQMIQRTSGPAAIAWLSATVLVAACSPAQDDPSATASEPRPVRVAEVQQAIVDDPVRGTGSFGFREQIPLSFKIGGIVSEITVDEGDEVRAGQILASLDLREIDAGLARARLGAEKALRDRNRAEVLYADSVVSLAQYQDAVTAHELAEADLEAASFNREFAVIRAPADGVVLGRSADPGQLTSAGAPVLILGSSARGGVVRVELSDRDRVRLTLGAEAAARFDALPGQSYSGRVAEMASQATPGSGTYGVEIVLDAPGMLVSGMIADVRIETSGSSRIAIVPVESVLELDGSQGSIFGLVPGTRQVSRRVIEVGALRGDVLRVLRGLDGIDEVVTEGAAWLNDGAEVRVVR